MLWGRGLAPRPGWLLLLPLVGLLALVLVRTAWVSDDAYISFRTIDNALHGYGLRWNVDERVQTFTHPLWLLLLTPLVALTGNPYLSSIGLSLVLGGVVIALLLRRASGPWPAAYGLVTLLLARAFVDFSTSGLENALSHALLAVLMTMTLEPAATRRAAYRIGLVSGLLGTTRLDLLVLAGPIALGAIRRPRTTLLPFAAGFWPLVLWEAFALVYYGVPFPNTAYAKLATGIPQDELTHQGLVYLLDSANRDPLTLFTILAAIALPFAVRRRAAVATSAALALYLVYVLRIGGDFMSGRFLTAPFVVGVFSLTAVDWPATWAVRAGPIAAAIALGLSAQVPTLSGLVHERTLREDLMWPMSGIVDERKFYFWRTSLVTAHGLRTHPDMGQTNWELSRLEAQHSNVVLQPTVGMVGYYIGPRVHVIDTLALGDPLLARLPSSRRWRIGHYERTLPDGYRESVERGTNLIRDPRIHALYDDIREVTRGPLFTTRRWKAIVRLNRKPG